MLFLFQCSLLTHIHYTHKAGRRELFFYWYLRQCGKNIFLPIFLSEVNGQHPSLPLSFPASFPLLRTPPLNFSLQPPLSTFIFLRVGDHDCQRRPTETPFSFLIRSLVADHNPKCPCQWVMRGKERVCVHRVSHRGSREQLLQKHTSSFFNSLKALWDLVSLGARWAKHQSRYRFRTSICFTVLHHVAIYMYIKKLSWRQNYKQKSLFHYESIQSMRLHFDTIKRGNYYFKNQRQFKYFNQARHGARLKVAESNSIE